MKNNKIVEIDVKQQDTIHCPACKQLNIVWEQFEAWIENAKPGGKKDIRCCHCRYNYTVKLIGITDYSPW